MGCLALHRNRLLPACVRSGQLDPNTRSCQSGARKTSTTFLEVHEMRSVRIALCTGLLLLAEPIFAQGGATGTILGTVSDSSGAIVPNAKVTVTNTATNVAFRTLTTSAGDFNAPSLNPGPYKISVEVSGFEKSVTNTVTLTVDQKARVDVTLKPAAVSETM